MEAALRRGFAGRRGPGLVTRILQTGDFEVTENPAAPSAQTSSARLPSCGELRPGLRGPGACKSRSWLLTVALVSTCRPVLTEPAHPTSTGFNRALPAAVEVLVDEERP
jgi:hypothetical protein